MASSRFGFSQLHFCSVSPILRQVVLGCLLIQLRLMRNSERPGFPTFCRSGQRETTLEEFNREVEGWLPLLPEVHLPRLTGQMLAGVVQRKGATAGRLDGWGWRELKVLPVPWYDELARILTRVEDVGVWPDGLLDAYIAMVPKTDGDSTPLGQRPLSVLPVVYRVWASAKMSQLGYLTLSSVPGVVVGRWKHGILLLLTLRKFLQVPLILIFFSLSLMWSSLLIRLFGVSWIVS